MKITVYVAATLRTFVDKRSKIVADLQALHIQALLQIGRISLKEVGGMITFQQIA